MQPFTMDGAAYNLCVTELRRSFAVLDTGEAGRTQNGRMYRDPVGTYYNYTMTVQRQGSDDASLDAFWEAVSAPVASHVCTFPYNRQTLTQRMYVTAGEQQLQLLRGEPRWGAVTVNFIAMDPQVTP